MKNVRLFAVVLALMLAATACDSLQSLPVPFGSKPTPTPVARAIASATPTAVSSSTGATAAPAPTSTAALTPASAAARFSPFWVQNHRITEMWSGPAGQPGVVSFGTTSQQFCSFRVVLPQDNDRLYVFNPYSQNYFWIDAAAVGPVGEPERRPGPKPANQNCAQAIYAE